MAFPTTSLDLLVEIALDTDGTLDVTDPTTWATWEDVSAYARERPRVMIRRGRPDEAGRTPPSSCEVTLDNSDGRFVPRNPSGAYYGQIGKNTPIRVSAEGQVRFTGYVSEWPPRWDVSGNDPFVTVTANGLLRRLSQGDAPLASAVRRSFLADGPVAYWPCEDASGAFAPSSATGGAPLVTSGEVTYGVDGPVGSLPLLTLGTTATLNGAIPVLTPTGLPGIESWSVEAMFYMPAAVTATREVMRVYDTGTVRQWIVKINNASPDTITLEGYNQAGTLVVNATNNFEASTPGEPYARWFHLILVNYQNATDITWNILINSYAAGSGYSGSVAGTLGRPLSLRISGNADEDPMGVGHVAVWDYNRAFDGSPGEAMGGYDGELAYDRITRLTSEEGVAWEADAATIVYQDDTSLLGPQQTSTWLEVLEAAHAPDDGILYERTDGKLGTQLVQGRYNLDPLLTLDVAAGEVGHPFEPTDDDQGAVNEYAASRTNGGSFTTSDQDGPMGVETIGRYDSSGTFDVQLDSQLAHVAGWAVHKGTVNELRYPRVILDLAKNPGLLAEWVAMDIGQVLRLTNLPEGLPPEDVDLLLVGYTETLGAYAWRVEMNCSPYSPYRISELGEESSRADTSGSELGASVLAAGTTLRVSTTTTGALWTTDNAECPVDIGIGGEQITVTDVAPSLITYVGVGTVDHDSNASVTPGLPASITTGDLLVMYAAIRNSGTGVPAAPAGWTRLPVFEASSNAQLFGRVATASESTPTVTFTGGVAGADTSAQIAAWRGPFANVDNVVSNGAGADCLNAAGQDIAHPGLVVREDNCLIIWCGWKQDDWTSVTGPGTEIAEPDTTTGDDQGLVWAYTIQTTGTAVAPGSFTVTGLANAISRGAVVAIRCDQQVFTVTRATNGVSKAHSAGASVSLWTPMTLAL